MLTFIVSLAYFADYGGVIVGGVVVFCASKLHVERVLCFRELKRTLRIFSMRFC